MRLLRTLKATRAGQEAGEEKDASEAKEEPARDRTDETPLIR
jgi:hypothetical protein